MIAADRIEAATRMLVNLRARLTGDVRRTVSSTAEQLQQAIDDLRKLERKLRGRQSYPPQDAPDR